MSIIEKILPWLAQWGYLAVFFGILVENLGIPVPGETVIIAASILAGQGLLRLDGVMAVSMAGAFLGGNFGYWVGAKGGRPFFERHGRWLGVTAEKLDRAEALFQGKGEWAVFFGRWVVLLRIFAGPLAGIVRMPFSRFLLFNALGAIGWVLVVAGVSYLCSNQLEMILGILHRLGWTGLALGVGLVLYFYRKK